MSCEEARISVSPAAEDSQSSEESDCNMTSGMTSTDYNTDDKLTPGLVSMNISNTTSTNRHSKRNRDSSFDEDTVHHRHTTSTTKGNKSKKDLYIHDEPSYFPLYPYGSNPPPIGDETFVNRSKKYCKLQPFEKRQKRLLTTPDVISNSDTSEVSGMDIKGDKRHSFDNHTSFYFVDNERNSCGQQARTSYNSNSRPFYPDFTSGQWYQAQCFDLYWQNYQQAMQWYQKHIQTVHMLNKKAAANMSNIPSAAGRTPKKSTKNSRKARATKRARNRRLSKARHRSASLDKAAEYVSESGAASDSGGEESCEQVEMEITDEMMKFFATSQKHKLERDQKKKEAGKEAEDVHINIEQVVSGQQAPSSSAPAEQPGLRRNAEMKVLYGSDSAMIHRMETALQLTFDRITDKCQPKLWPNMPLKITFT